jgi:ectoine hydroxylase-related dioxygenase (phytanoyl-CoA dioxygenase family)
MGRDMQSHRPLGQILEEIERDGYAIVEGALDADVVRTLRRDLEAAIEREAAAHGGADYQDFGMVLVCCAHARSFVDLLGDEAVMGVVDGVLGEGCIVYAYTSSSMPPGGTNYSHRIHVDCPRLIPGYLTNMAMVGLLDDFTAENGATWLLPGSHHTIEAPTEQDFLARARRVIAPAGSVLYFNPRLWHSGGVNTTDRWRHAVTINFCRPFMKQRLDVPRIMATSGVDLGGASERALQKMGYYAQVPVSLDEYYLPPAQRKYRQRAE